MTHTIQRRTEHRFIISTNNLPRSAAFQLRKLAVVVDLEGWRKNAVSTKNCNWAKRVELTHWEDGIAASVFSQVNVEATCTRNLLQDTLLARNTAQIVQTTDDTEHGGQGNAAGITSEAGVWTLTVVDVRVQRTVETDLIGLREDIRVACSSNEADENLFALGDVDFLAPVVDSDVALGFTVGAIGTIQTDTFQGVVTQGIVRFGGVLLCEAVDLWQMRFALIRQVEIDDLGELEALLVT